MKCSKCHKDFKAGVKTAYKLGIQDGRNEYEKHLNRIEKTMGRLFDELRIMDYRTPDKANKVYFSLAFLDKLIKCLKKKCIFWWATAIRKEIKRQIGERESAQAKLREVLSEIEE